MNDLLRELAPISSEAWSEIEEEAKRTLTVTSAARKVVDFTGPLGWGACAIDLGRTEDLAKRLRPGIQARLRLSQPLVELRVPFELSRRELEAVARGAKDADLQPVVDAARAIAMAEDHAVFHGCPDARIEGICAAAGKSAVRLPADFEAFPRTVAASVNKLRNAGVAGPYALILSPECYTGLTETTTSAGYPIFQHVRRLVDGPMVWAPGVEGAAMLSTRGGDFELTVGQDFSIGYLEHTEATVALYLQESFTFRVLAPEAAVALTPAAGGRRRRS